MKKTEVETKIGKKILIDEARNKDLIGIEGEVIDETKNMLTLKTKNGEKKLIKKQIIFK